MSTLHLSRLSLRRDPSLASLVPLLVPPDGEALADAAHRLIWAAFADDPERKRDFLWRQDDSRRWLVLSSRQPDDPHRLFEIETKRFDPALRSGQHLLFALRANAVVARKDAKGLPRRCDVVMDRLHAVPPVARAIARPQLALEAGRDWLGRQGARAGFHLDHVDSATYRTHRIPRRPKAKPIELGVLDLEGAITVEDPGRFMASLAAGFGKAKAFGFGLMLIRRGP